MTQRDWFSLALRILGVMRLLEAATFLLQAFDIHGSYFKAQMSTVDGSLHQAYLQAVLGIVLVFGAPFFAGLVIRGAPRAT